MLSFRLRIYPAVFIAVLALGTVGFVLAETLSSLDALHFTIVTVGTVGRGDIHPVTPVGKALAITIIVMGVGTLLGVIANIAETVIRRQEKQERLEKLNMVIGVFFNDMERAYALLAMQWLAYMWHLKAAYPYLFSLAVRLNPFLPNPSSIVQP